MNTINLIFDFDGTIADSLNAAIKIYNEHHQSFGTPPIDMEIKQQLRAMSSRKILRTLGPRVALLPKVLYTVRQKMAREIASILPIAEITDTLHTLRNHPSIKLSILTSNTKKKRYPVLSTT